MSAQHPLMDLWQRFSNGSRPQQALTLLRVAVGLYFLFQGYQKFSSPQFEATLGSTLKTWAAHNPVPFYKHFLTNIAIPNAAHLATWVTDGELAVGLSYTLGWLIRFSAPLAMLMNLNFLLAAQHTGAGMLEVNATFIVMSWVLYWGQAGQYFGLDGLKAPSDSKPKSTKEPAVKKSKKLEAVTESLKQAHANESPAKNGNKRNVRTRINPF